MRFWVFALVFGGCVGSDTVLCGERTCPSGAQCAVITGTPVCATAEQLAPCENEAELASCDPDDERKRCHSGVCIDLCGNGVMDLGEVCDDGNISSGDGCSARCFDELCGNGVIDPLQGEECDDALAQVSGDGCSSNCKVETASWTNVTPPPLVQVTGAAMASDGARIIMFGGRAEAGLTDEMWTRIDAIWRRVFPPRLPPRREQHSIAYDPNRNRFVLFGGFGTAGVLGDTWEWDGTSWTDRTPTVSPPPRFGTQLAYDPGSQRIVLVGGRTVQDAVSDMWTWDGTTWSQVSLPALPPDPHTDVQLAYDVTHSYLVYCGAQAVSGGGAHTLRWSGTSWVDLNAPCPSDGIAPNRMVYNPASASLVLYSSTARKTYEWTGTAWVELTVGANAPPSVRTGIGLAADQFSIIMYGGADLGGVVLGGNPARLVYDSTGATWSYFMEGFLLQRPPAAAYSATAFDPLTGHGVVAGGGGYGLDSFFPTWLWGRGKWVEVPQATTPDTIPSPRADAALAYDPIRRQFVMFGGTTGPQETWVLAFDAQLSSWSWSQRTPASSPSPRRGAQMVFDAARGQIVLFGGNIGMTLFGDTWSWNGTAWSQLATTGPAPRTRHALTYDDVRQRIVLFGGYDELDDVAGDTWEWDGTVWTMRATTGPVPRAAATLTFDPLRRRSVLIGGTDYPVASGTFDDWWEWDGTTWTMAGSDPAIARSGHAAFYDAFRRGIVIHGGAKSALARDVTNDETWMLTFTAAGEGRETCQLDNEDADGDGRMGCDDPECWARCAPLCPPGTSCPADAPKCGDGVCSPVEDYVICPGTTPTSCDGT